MDELKQIKPEWVPEAYREVDKVIGIKIQSVIGESALPQTAQSFSKKGHRSLVTKRRKKG